MCSMYTGIGPGAHGRLTDFAANKRVRTFGVSPITIETS